MKREKSIENKSLKEFLKKCKDFDLKITPQRIAIYKEVLNSKNHPSAEVIYRKIKKSHPGISFDTVNRTLLTLTKIGLLEVVEGSGDVRRFDPNYRKHHHFRCTNCGKIVDFYCEKCDNLEIPEDIKVRFTVNKIKVILEGICSNCSKKT